ncbi:TraB/GumN family protein [Aliishimia ponticola]|uniref:TraB/GumN family protein n=1 Tax=Aliishimia ponticola TaxID=2499833 RepID=A0A4S4NLD9_9RHOB|nr:TraB/GumN family protein [Aliishimia ponticola]THH36990.1 TraB/GumN family protein [Aliishimia ponticola]
MFKMLCSALAFSLLPLVANAACEGVDDRTRLTSDEAAELARRLSDIPYPEGNYWTATRGDKVLHLVGTVHIADPRLDAVMERLKPVLDRADLLMVEMTAEEEAKLEHAVGTRPELLFLTTGPTLPELLDDASWQELAAAARSRGIPPIMAAKFQPWYLSLTLSMPACVIEQMRDEGRGLDHMLMEYARQIDLPQQALEPYDTLFRLFGQEPLEKQVEYLKFGVLPDDMAENAMATLMNAYFEERASEIFALTYITARWHADMPAAELEGQIDEFLGIAIDQRNLSWMDRILAAPDGVTVIASGAGHLAGEAGLLNLLAAEGFTLARQPF